MYAVLVANAIAHCSIAVNSAYVVTPSRLKSATILMNTCPFYKERGGTRQIQLRLACDYAAVAPTVADPFTRIADSLSTHMASSHTVNMLQHIDTLDATGRGACKFTLWLGSVCSDILTIGDAA